MELVNYYLKAIVGAVVAGLTYFMTVLAPTATLSDVTLVQWIGFAVSVLGTFAGVAAVTNGPKPGAVVEYDGRHEAGPLN
jgi:hypothetical protein